MDQKFGKVQVVKKVLKKKEEGVKGDEFEVVSDESDILEVPFFPEGVKPATVSVGMEYTRQIRSYEPIKISVHVSMPCHANESEIDSTYKRVSSIVSAKMKDASASLNEAAK
jgi:hypothetical protein